MRRFARGATLLAMLLGGTPMLAPASIFAQSPPAGSTSPEPPLVTEFDAAFLRDLPTGENLSTLIETLQPSIISDRFSAGGLNAAVPARLGGFLSSPRETLFRLDGVPITDPTGSGTPVLLPELMLWDRVKVGTGRFGADTNATGLVIDLSPAVPTDEWTRNVEGSSSHAGLTGHERAAGLPAIVRLAGWDHAAIIAGGPLIPARLSALFAGSWTRASQFSNADRFAVDSEVASVFSHLTFTPNLRDRIRVIGWLQQRSSPLDERHILSQPQATIADTGGHAQAVWEHDDHARMPWRVYAGYSGRRETPDYDRTSTGITERLVDGPVTQLASISKNTVQTWSLGARVEPSRTLFGLAHRFGTGIEATGGRAHASSFFAGTVGELVNESPARVWTFTSPAAPSLRRNVMVGAYTDDRVALLPRVTFSAGVRIESTSGRADGAAQSIDWHSVLPRASADWAISDRGHMAAFAGYTRSAYRLALDDLAVGDPGAPTADVFRWNAFAGATLPLSARGALVMRAGPGTGGDPNFNAIDPDLRRPTADEIVLGFEARPFSSLFVRVTGVARTETDLLGVVNPGAFGPLAYASFTVTDPGANVLSPDDDKVLTVFNRLPSSYGQDRYVLTNPVQQNATFKGLELTLKINIQKLLITGGATASLAESSAANRGFGALENDQDLLGELFSNPNADTLARGRPFTDRGFTGKLAGLYRFPADVRLGFVARYQDGQPFSRVLVFPGLNQGAEAVRAFSSGESRFLFVGTLDTRLQKGFTLGGRRVDVFLDAFNLPGRSNAVEEDVALGPDVRVGTVAQPPRAFHVGARVAF